MVGREEGSRELRGLDLTLMSLFGCFALSGIVVNDSIILVDFYRWLRRIVDVGGVFYIPAKTPATAAA